MKYDRREIVPTNGADLALVFDDRFTDDTGHARVCMTANTGVILMNETAARRLIDALKLWLQNVEEDRRRRITDNAPRLPFMDTV